MNGTESRIDRAMRFSRIWWKSRADAGKSQEYMALGLGVSKKTIQNWERGISSPDLFQGTDWFRLLGLNPMHYYLEFIYPWLESSDRSGDDNDGVEKALIELIKQTTPLEKQQLLFLMSGDHGSSWYALLQMFTAHCQTTMQSRAAAAGLIRTNFNIERSNNTLVCPNNIMPDIKLLDMAIREGIDAARNDNKGYTGCTDSQLSTEE